MPKTNKQIEKLMSIFHLKHNSRLSKTLQNRGMDSKRLIKLHLSSFGAALRPMIGDLIPSDRIKRPNNCYKFNLRAIKGWGKLGYKCTPTHQFSAMWISHSSSTRSGVDWTLLLKFIDSFFLFSISTSKEIFEKETALMQFKFIEL